MRTFAQCMRSHGVPSWPDPTPRFRGAPGFDIRCHVQGFAASSSQTECQQRLPSALGPGDPPLE